MRVLRAGFVAVLVLIAPAAQAATIVFDADPFAGTDALTTDGRQVVGGLGTPFAFDVASDVILFDPAVFGVSELLFANTLTSGLPTSGVNVVVVQDTGTPFLAGLAADLIAARIDATGPGFFVYFNTNLSVARLVFSTDLSDDEADLAILARLTTLSNLEHLGGLTEANFGVAAVPEPGTMLLFATAAAVFAVRRRVQRGRAGSPSPALD